MKDISEVHEFARQEDTIRSMIAREDDLVNHRMTWLATFNGLLLAALGFSWDKSAAKPISILLCILGLLTSMLSASGIIQSGAAQRRLLILWRKKKPSNYTGPGVMGIEPADAQAFSLYFTWWSILAIAFSIAWLLLIVYVWKYAKL